MVKVAYRIMACFDRMDMVKDELTKLAGGDVKVFYDDRPKDQRVGTYYTQLKCINDALAGDYTHLVLIQDDVLLANRFDDCIHKLIEAKPYDLWTLFCPRLHEVDFQNPYIEIFPANTWGQCNVIPIPMLKMIMKFREEKLPNYIYDDGLYLMYCIENKIPVYTTKVALLQHLCPTTSMLGYNNKHKVSKVWVGEDVFDKINWSSDKFKRKSIPTSCDFEKEYKKYGRH